LRAAIVISALRRIVLFTASLVILDSISALQFCTLYTQRRCLQVRVQAKIVDMAVGQKGWFSKELTVRMILFNTLFHGLHIGLFVFGWSVLSLKYFLEVADVVAGGNKRPTSD